MIDSKVGIAISRVAERENANMKKMAGVGRHHVPYQAMCIENKPANKGEARRGKLIRNLRILRHYARCSVSIIIMAF